MKKNVFVFRFALLKPWASTFEKLFTCSSNKLTGNLTRAWLTSALSKKDWRGPNWRGPFQKKTDEGQTDEGPFEKKPVRKTCNLTAQKLEIIRKIEYSMQTNCITNFECKTDVSRLLNCLGCHKFFVPSELVSHTMWGFLATFFNALSNCNQFN